MSTDSGKRSLYGGSSRPYTVNREKFRIRNLRYKMFNTMKVHKEKDSKLEGRYTNDAISRKLLFTKVDDYIDKILTYK